MSDWDEMFGEFVAHNKIFRGVVIGLLLVVTFLGILNSGNIFSAVIIFAIFWVLGFFAFKFLRFVYRGTSAYEAHQATLGASFMKRAEADRVATLDALGEAFPPPEGEPVTGLLSPSERKVWDSMVSRMVFDEDDPKD